MELAWKKATWKEADTFGSYCRVQVKGVVRGKLEENRKRGWGTKNNCLDEILELDGWTWRMGAGS